jgi:hypothetical protein
MSEKIAPAAQKSLSTPRAPHNNDIQQLARLASARLPRSYHPGKPEWADDAAPNGVFENGEMQA